MSLHLQQVFMVKLLSLEVKCLNNTVFWEKYITHACKLCGKTDDNVDSSEHVWIRSVLIHENMDLVL